MADDVDDTEQGPEEPQDPAAEDGEEVEQREAGGLWDQALHAVTQARAFCENAAWQELYQWMLTQIDGHKLALETTKKIGDVIEHQSAIHTLRTIIGRVFAPVTAFNALYEDMPLWQRPQAIEPSVNEDGTISVTISVVEGEHEPETQEATA